MSSSIFSRPEIVWFLLGLLLFLAELALPGFFIFFFAVGAWVTALVCLIGNPSTNWQIVIFALTSVITLATLRKMIQRKFFDGNSSLGSDSVEDEFTGREARAVSNFGPGRRGKVEFKGTIWDAESVIEIEEGQIVIITGKENFKLYVKSKTN
jgi:membrane protein implicated in regulation of membrane protease activity